MPSRARARARRPPPPILIVRDRIVFRQQRKRRAHRRACLDAGLPIVVIDRHGSVWGELITARCAPDHELGKAGRALARQVLTGLVGVGGRFGVGAKLVRAVVPRGASRKEVELAAYALRDICEEHGELVF